MDLFERNIKIDGLCKYSHSLYLRIIDIELVIKNGSHAVNTSKRINYWGCTCSNEDVNATKCDACYNVSTVRDIFKIELFVLKSIYGAIKITNHSETPRIRAKGQI